MAIDIAGVQLSVVDGTVPFEQQTPEGQELLTKIAQAVSGGETGEIITVGLPDVGMGGMGDGIGGPPMEGGLGGEMPPDTVIPPEEAGIEDGSPIGEEPPIEGVPGAPGGEEKSHTPPPPPPPGGKSEKAEGEAEEEEGEAEEKEGEEKEEEGEEKEEKSEKKPPFGEAKNKGLEAMKKKAKCKDKDMKSCDEEINKLADMVEDDFIA